MHTTLTSLVERHRPRTDTILLLLALWGGFIVADALTLHDLILFGVYPRLPSIGNVRFLAGAAVFGTVCYRLLSMRLSRPLAWGGTVVSFAVGAWLLVAAVAVVGFGGTFLEFARYSLDNLALLLADGLPPILFATGVAMVTERALEMRYSR